MISIKINIIPRALQSVRTRIIKPKGKKPFIMHYQQAWVKKYKDEIIRQAKSQLPKDFQLFNNYVEIVKLIYVFPMKKTENKRNRLHIEQGGFILKNTKPDFDNLMKPFADALEGIIWKNDSRVCISGQRYKVYGSEPCIYLEVKERENEFIQLDIERNQNEEN